MIIEHKGGETIVTNDDISHRLADAHYYLGIAMATGNRRRTYQGRTHRFQFRVTPVKRNGGRIMTVNEFVRRIQTKVSMLSTGDIPIKLNGKDIECVIELIENGKGYYINIKQLTNAITLTWEDVKNLDYLLHANLKTTGLRFWERRFPLMVMMDSTERF